MVEYIGFDVSKEETAFCVKNKEGAVLARGKALTDPKTLFDALKKHTLCPERIVLETGTMSAWLARELRCQGRGQKRVDQIAVGSMNLDNFETSLAGAADR